MSTWAQFISLPLTRLLQSKRLSLLKWIKYLRFSRFSSCYSRHIARCYSSCWVRFFRGLLAWCKKWSRLGVYWACNTHHLGQWIFHSSLFYFISMKGSVHWVLWQETNCFHCLFGSEIQNGEKSILNVWFGLRVLGGALKERVSS